MRKTLFFEAIIKIILGFFIVGLLIFIPAGTICFWRGWLLIGLFFLSMLSAGGIMIYKNPDLLAKRLNGKEEQKEQLIVIISSAIMFCAGFIAAGLNYRFLGYTLPLWVTCVATLVFVASYVIYGVVMIENPYLSRVIEVFENQRVIKNGLYGVIRHPMYMATIFLFLSMPFILGSIYSFIIFCTYPFIIVKRIKNEEKFLEKNLKGYSEYMEKVKYRLIPFVW